jgi:hypothetical protein
MDVQQLKEIEKWVMGTMIVVMVVLWVFVRWALRKSKELEADDDHREMGRKSPR